MKPCADHIKRYVSDVDKFVKDPNGFEIDLIQWTHMTYPDNTNSDGKQICQILRYGKSRFYNNEKEM